MDERGVPRHAHKRSLNRLLFRLNEEGSDPRYSFHHTGPGDQLYVFEAPIDLLSFLTLYQKDWNEDPKARRGLPAQGADKREQTQLLRQEMG